MGDTRGGATNGAGRYEVWAGRAVSNARQAAAWDAFARKNREKERSARPANVDSTAGTPYSERYSARRQVLPGNSKLTEGCSTFSSFAPT